MASISARHGEVLYCIRLTTKSHMCAGYVLYVIRITTKDHMCGFPGRVHVCQFVRGSALVASIH